MPWKNSQHKYIAEQLEVKKSSRTDIYVHCPFHEDTNKSASINFKKELFNCFNGSCIGGLNFEQLERELKHKEHADINPSSEKIREKVINKVGVLDEQNDLEDISISYLQSRGFSDLPINFQCCTNHTDTDGEYNPFYGYLLFESLDGYIVGRNLIEDDPNRPRYLNESTKKEAFWVARDYGSKIIFITEGIFDALSLADLGLANVFATLGTGFPKHAKEKIAYELRNNTVIIIYDNDAAGFKGSRRISEVLVEYEVDHSIVEMPKELGTDINDAFVSKKPQLQSWIKSILGRFDPDDKSYVQNLFTGQGSTNLNLIKSGIPALDKKLTGGFKDGAHVISGETGVGKTSIVFHLAINAVEQGKKVMINSCEISKRQSWARLASKFSRYSWEELESDPTLIEKKALKEVKRLSQNILVVNGWPLQRILQESPSYDMIIIDYIQRVRETYGGSDKESMQLINTYIARMSDLGAINGKVVLIVSSLARNDYNNPNSYGFKGSGSIEYMAATASRLMPIGVGEKNKFIWRIQKNTRGETGNIRIAGVDLGHINFDNVTSEEVHD